MPPSCISDVDVLVKKLGPGPMRFAATGERSIEDQITALSAKEKEGLHDALLA
jgi:hypothetical protein